MNFSIVQDWKDVYKAALETEGADTAGRVT
jgi:hypothetical protein